MKTFILYPQIKQLSFEDIAEPVIQKDNEVKLRVLEVGICGTDREQITHGKAIPPEGSDAIILGHEMLGEVVEVGKHVQTLKKGDLATVTVRRGCNRCSSCTRGRFDLCCTENYQERGIKGSHGFHAEYVIDEEAYIIKLPNALREVGVLTEPLSVVEKALDEILQLQKARLADWRDETDYKNKNVLIAGLGPIGLLACFALRLRGFQVWGLDIVDKGAPRTRILEALGGQYIDGRNTKAQDVARSIGQVDLIFEAAGIAKLDFDLFHSLGINGGYVITGVPHHGVFEINGGQLMHHFVLKNQLALGSVNAAKKHWEQAVIDLEKCYAKWPQLLKSLITARFPPDHLLEKIEKPAKDDIKVVVTWDGTSSSIT